MSTIKVPSPRNYGSFEVESFEKYHQRWPKKLSNFPRCVIENWVYRHWGDFRDKWLKFDLRTFRFELTQFSNAQIMAIGLFEDSFRTLNYWGDDLFEDEMRRNSWLGKYVLEHGTSPAPIIVAINAGDIIHPRGGAFLKTPTHLIEGHMRLAYLRGMIRRQHDTLKTSHPVWLLSFERCNRMSVDIG